MFLLIWERHIPILNFQLFSIETIKPCFTLNITLHNHKLLVRMNWASTENTNLLPLGYNKMLSSVQSYITGEGSAVNVNIQKQNNTVCESSN